MATQQGNLQRIIPALFTGRGGQLMTPDQIAREREIAAALMAPNQQPITNWADGAAGLVDAFSGKMRETRANQASDRNAANSQRIQQALFGSLGGGSAPAMAPAFSPQAAIGGGIQPTVSAPGPAASVPTGDRASYIRQGLLQRGLPQHVADAFIVNFQDESGLNPGINEAKPLVPGSRGGYGLYQLTGPRRREYEAFAQAQGIPLDSIDGQLDFLVSELQGSEARAGQSILSAPDTASAAQAIVNNFLRPAPEHRQSRSARYARLGGGAVQVASLDPSIGMPESAGPMDAMRSGSVAQALFGPSEAPAQQPQQVAQALMPQEPYAAPQQAAQPYQPSAPAPINPAILEALSSPYVDDQTRQIGMMLFQQEQQAQAAQAQAVQEWNALQEQRQYDFGLTQEQRGYDRFLTGDQRAYDATLLNASNAREDARNRFLDTRQAGRDQRSDFESDRNFGLAEQGLTPTSVREYEYAVSQGYPGTFAEFEQAQRSAAAQNITVNTGEGNKFYETLDADNAKTFSALSEEGVRGRSKLSQIDRLEGLLSNAQTGGLAVLKQYAGEWGINTEGLSDIQAAQALINELVPQQRQPGSGPMSDADLALFKQSLPRLINQPGGNQTIIDTMRGITEYQIQMGNIADAVADRSMTPAQAREAIRSLANPLDGFKVPPAGQPDTTRRDGGVPVGGQQPAISGMGVPAAGEMPQVQSQEAYDALPRGATFIAPDGSVRRKP